MFSPAFSIPTSYSEFRDLVLEVVATWIVGGMLDIGAEIVGAVLAVFDSFRAVGDAIQSPLLTLGSLLAALPYYLLDAIEPTIMLIAQSSGPLAPFVVVILWSATVALLGMGLRLALGLVIRVIPVL